MTGPLPWITADEMREVDRVAVEEYGIDLVRMMESAGAVLARAARRLHLGGEARGRRVVVLAGSGGNGGGALVCARRLAAWGARVEVVLATSADRLGAVPREQLSILRRMGVEAAPLEGSGADPDERDDRGAEAVGEEDVEAALREGPVDLVVDGVIGYSLRGAPREGAARLVAWTGEAGAPVLSVDVPSGVDASTGELPGTAVRASTTVTLALPKAGLRVEPGRTRVGDLWLADIGIPPAIYADVLGIRVDTPFSASDLVRLQPTPPGR